MLLNSNQAFRTIIPFVRYPYFLLFLEVQLRFLVVLKTCKSELNLKLIVQDCPQTKAPCNKVTWSGLKILLHIRQAWHYQFPEDTFYGS